MYYKIYTSTANCEISDADLKGIIDSAERNNQRNNITGLLTYYDGLFIQMLEGEQDDVEKTLRRIAQDPRHHQVMILFEGETSKRHFPDWKMAMQVVDESTFKNIQSYEPLKDGERFLKEVEDEHIGIKMLRYFYEMKKH